MMNNERSNLWWLPSSLFALVAILFLVMALYGRQRYTAVWIALSVVFFVVAGMNFRRRQAAK
jgi:hypothetical protein